MTRVLHTGDTHVGYRQYHEPERRRDFLAAFERVVEDAIAEDVDAVVHAGDLFHDRRPDLRALQGVVGALRELREAEIPFLAVVGNHEATRSGQWLDLFADLDLAERLGAEPRVVGDLALYGLDHVPQSKRPDLEYDFAPHDSAAAALVGHGLFEPFDPGEWDTGRLLAESSVEFDGLLLGDNHDPGTKQLEGAWITYCGSTERASAAERADRGYNLVTVEDGELRISRRTVETRPFVFVDCELEPGEGADVVRERVRQHDHEDAVTVVTIEGDGEPITPGPIEELALDRGAIVARVNDRRDVEVEDETAMDVHFADPDDAVRQRLRELGLSEAARDVDRVVRDEDVADSNVRDRVRRQVSEHLEDGLAAFEPAPDDVDQADASDDADAVADAEASDEATAIDDAAAADGATEPEDGSEASTETAPAGDPPDVSDDAADDGESTADEAEQTTDGADQTEDEEVEAAEAEEREEATVAASEPESQPDQLSMEDYQ